MIGGLSSAMAIVLVGGAVALLGWLVGGGAYRDADGKALVLRYPAKLRGLAVLCGVILPAAIAIAVLAGNQTGYQSPARTVGLLGLAGFFLLLGLPLCMEGFRKQVMLSEDAIASRSWFGSLKEIEWSDVKRVTNHPISGYICIFGAGVTVKVNHYLSGLDTFVAECKRRLEPSQYGNTFDTPISNPFA
jgi:hypothetical protein